MIMSFSENYRQNEAKLKTAFEQRTIALQQAEEVSSYPHSYPLADPDLQRYEALKNHAEKKLESFVSNSLL